MRILHYLSLLCVLILLQSCLQDDLRTPVVREATQEDPFKRPNPDNGSDNS
ncbi:hypothetical protein QW060_18075 [Myroides ceti]|uniref:Uncharacterized protein n=1 Tax=Paenimyroides ceti TaxID=395087 RepID=A0ABT8D0L6_9FLAO|nr:hypothetical protein [Paenimyroides ceti]MDN3708985.1 hypothetical protein [Paenimyroides ceti]